MRKQPAPPAPHRAAPTPTADVTPTATPAVEAPRVRRLGALPHVTTAFGGSFTP